MKNKILDKLNELEKQIQNFDFSPKAIKTSEWEGADVIISNQMCDTTRQWLEEQPAVISLQETEPRRRAVITEYAKELSWLFCELKEIFSERIDHISKYDFYGLLAQAAIDCLEKTDGKKDIKTLLLTVLEESKGYLEK